MLGRVGCFSDGVWFLVCDRPFQKLPAHTHQHQHHSHRNQAIEAAQRSVGPNSPSRMEELITVASDEETVGIDRDVIRMIRYDSGLLMLLPVLGAR